MRAPIKTALALAITLPAAAGCEKSPKDRLQGRWLGESVENVPVSELQKATGWVKGTALELNGNKVTVTIPAEPPRSGTFKVARVEGDHVWMTFQRDDGGGREEVQLRLVGERSMRLNVGGGREIVMLRARN